MICKVYDINPLLCLTCGETMKVIVFIKDHKVKDHIIDRIKLTFLAEHLPPIKDAHQEF